MVFYVSMNTHVICIGLVGLGQVYTRTGKRDEMHVQHGIDK